MIALQILKVSTLVAFLSAPFVVAQASDASTIIGVADPAATKIPVVSGPVIWKEPAAPLDARVHDLVNRMSLAEKVSQLMADAPAVPRLGIPAYSYRNECLHGVVCATGVATVFPEPIGMAATWDPPLIRKEAKVIATEARAHFNHYRRKHHGSSVIHEGISFYAPNLNLDRDPRWGRNQETYGEDPFLIAQFGVAFIRGLQGNNPKYIEALACAKHYAVYSGPEPLRTYLNMRPSKRDLYDTYLPAFEAAVREGHVGSVMGAYPALYGVPDCENPFLLTQLLRERWSFQGFVVSDGGAICLNWIHHKYEATAEEAAANAVKAGCDLFSANIARGNYPWRDYTDLGLMLKEELVSEKEIDNAVSLTLAARFRLGLFDPPSMVAYSKIMMAQNNTPAHRALALKVAQESMVLLKNNGLLPLDRTKIKRIAVIGPNANSSLMLLGNYHGTPSRSVTILAGIRQVAGTNIAVTYDHGCPLALKNDNSNKPTPEMTQQAVEAAKSADVVIYVGGLDSSLECESAKVPYQGFVGGDRTRIALPAPQEELLKGLYATGKPIVCVNCSGDAIAMPWAANHLAAIVQAWYPGEEGGLAVAQVLFGQVNPSGRLPVTFYRSTKDLPPFTDYSMSNRTYRYFNGKPLFAFGYGLSYTKFDYTDARLDATTFSTGETIKLSFKLKNIGRCDGTEVGQVYFRPVHAAATDPRLALCGFRRVHLSKGESKTVRLDIPVERFRLWDTTKNQYMVKPGDYQLLIGAASDDIRLRTTVKIATKL